MDTKIIILESDGGLFSLEVDTNRVVTDFGHETGGHYAYVAFGVIFNIGQMFISFYYIGIERRDAAIMKSFLEKEAAEADGKHKAEAEEDSDDDDDEEESE